MVTSFWVNGKEKTVQVDPQKPLLWVLREQLDLYSRASRPSRVAQAALASE